MEILNQGLEKFIRYASQNRPDSVEITTETDDSGTDFIVTEHWAVFTGNYLDRDSVNFRKKYGGTTSLPEEMEKSLDRDIARLQELGLTVSKKKGFI